ncbi:hypothetical protein J6590_082683 [Homalodisca vitripennis]|nr:hypothetical protein J6590_082683 [Homalodisca vitripennis]
MREIQEPGRVHPIAGVHGYSQAQLQVSPGERRRPPRRAPGVISRSLVAVKSLLDLFHFINQVPRQFDLLISPLPLAPPATLALYSQFRPPAATPHSPLPASWFTARVLPGPFLTSPNFLFQWT